jgi:hypothetical protein
MSGPAQFAFNNVNSATTLQITLSGIVGGLGDMIVVYCGSPTGARTFTVSDSNTGAYTVVINNTPRASCAIATLINPNVGSTTITITISGAATTILGIAEEWPTFGFTQTGADRTAFNNSGAVSGTSGNTNTTLTLSQASELVLSAFVTANAVNSLAVSAPWTAGPLSPVSVTNGALASSYGTVSSTAGVIANYTWVNSVQWGGCIATFPQPIVTVFNPVDTQSKFFTQDRLLVT